MAIKRMYRDWAFSLVIFGIIVISMSGAVERTPFEIDKSFERLCGSHWMGQEMLINSRDAQGERTITQSCQCITDSMMLNGASKEEFGVLIQWLTTTRNYDLKKYYEIAKFKGDAVFDKSLKKCSNIPVETAMQ